MSKLNDKYKNLVPFHNKILSILANAASQQQPTPDQSGWYYRYFTLFPCNKSCVLLK
jgi:hypothetical protein